MCLTFEARGTGIACVLVGILFYPLRDDHRWAAFLVEVGLLEYWRAMPAEYGGHLG